MKCEYCNSSIIDGELNCGNCGAPSRGDGDAERDFRACPACHRKLLALGSPACNYCGRRLPDEYIKAREADLRRLTEASESAESGEVNRKVDELIRETAQSKRGQSLSALGLPDITRIIDLFL